MSDPTIYEALLRSISSQGLVFGHMPCAVLAGWNCLFAVRPAETVKLALRLAGMVPALDVKLAGVMVLV